jgi:subtilisin family serine protease
MKKLIWASLGTLGLTTLVQAQAVLPGAVVPHQFVIRAAPNQSAQVIGTTYGAQVVACYAPHRLYLLQTPAHNTPQQDSEVQTRLQADARVNTSELNRVFASPEGTTQSFFVSVAPPDYPDQPAVNIVGLSPTLGPTGQGITVAILDTGVGPHTALQARLTTAAFNFVDNNSDTSDVGDGLDDNGDGQVDEMVGHGTMVAGLVFLAAPAAQLMPVKVLNSDGEGTTFSVAAGIYFASDHAANIINLSLASPRTSQIIDDAIAAAGGHAIVVGGVANDDTAEPSYPAASPGVIAVAATDNTDHKAPFSNYGSYVSICAPGTGVVSTFPGDQYARASGCSFASALVSGVAALAWSGQSSDSASRVAPAILNTATGIDSLNPSYATLLGHGRVDAASAVTAVPHCGTADFNGDGDVGTDADIEAFFACLAGSCCAACDTADFNGDGDVGTDSDIEAFFRVLAGGSC